MTIDEIGGFSKAIAKKGIHDRIQFITGVLLGAQAEGKIISKNIKELEKIAKSIV